MIIKLDKKRVKELLEKYYKDEYDSEGKIIMHVEKDYVGYGMDEHIDCVVSATFIGKMDILGEETEFKVELYSKQINDVIRKIFEKEGYEVSDASCDSGLDYRTEGYGMGENTISYPYFKGVKVRINENVINRGGIKNEKR